MTSAPQEMEDLSQISNALLLNIGNLTAASLEGMALAGEYVWVRQSLQLTEALKPGRFANTTRKPVVFDPVGVGATSFRKSAVNGRQDIMFRTLPTTPNLQTFSTTHKQLSSKEMLASWRRWQVRLR
jgi:hydroxyethylthiazole kinase-like sugar kinase family protein